MPCSSGLQFCVAVNPVDKQHNFLCKQISFTNSIIFYVYLQLHKKKGWDTLRNMHKKESDPKVIRGWKCSPGAADLKMTDWAHVWASEEKQQKEVVDQRCRSCLNRLSSLSKRSGKRIRRKADKGKDHPGPHSPL